MSVAYLPAIPLLSVTKTLKSSPNTHTINLNNGACFPSNKEGSKNHMISSFSFAGNVLRTSFIAPMTTKKMGSISNSAAGYGGGGGDDDGFGGGDGDGDGGSNSGETETTSIGVGSEDAVAVRDDVIFLDVGGMTCNGCAASVKRILESKPQVSSAAVNLDTETAVVCALPEATVSENWRQELGEELADHLTTCGFKSNFSFSGQEQYNSIEGTKEWY